MKKALFAKIVFLIVLGGCSIDRQFEKLSDGVVIVPEQPTDSVRKVRIQVVGDNIIRVTATAADTFSRARSLMVTELPQTSPKWETSESDSEIALTTARLRVTISKKTGEVSFFDKDGNTLLAERQGGGKSFVKTVVDNSRAYSVRQVFESPDDEAFYGLGGHQNGQMNYKGEDVDLTQHNIVDVVPFVYSSRNYGLLWDNYSIGKFGDPRAYEPLNTLQLFSRDGKPGGLTADYYVENRVVKSFIEDKIEYEYLETPQVDNFPKDVAQKGKVIWEGSFASNVGGEHKFLLYGSGYFKVWIDGKLIMDKWRQNWNPWTNKFTAALEKGQQRKIRIEWKPDGGFMAVRHLDPLPAEEQRRLSMAFEVADEIDYYFIRGNSADEVISGYRALTGKAPIVPKWALGFWQSRERYRNQQELLDVVKEYRKRNIPLDNIVLDWQYWRDPEWGSHDFDDTRFPDPAGMVKTLHNDLHANIMISVWPKFNKGTEHFDEMNRQGFLFTRNIEKRRKDWVGVGYESTFYDPFNPAAGKLFWDQIDRKLNRLGFDAWWLDATEPDMHSNLSLDERKRNMSPTAMGPGAKFFNAYSLVNSKSVYEGSRKSDPDKRVFILTRSAYAGQQRYGAATWSGDIVSRWSDFQDQIAAGINFSLSGIPYWTMDIGGFAVESRYYDAKGETLDEWRELNTRWFQYGAFTPLFRSHGQYPFREIYNIAPAGHEAYETMVYYDRLRYAMLPYIYSLAGWTYLNDYTPMRGLVMDFAHDRNTYGVADQYMFGPSLLVSPVYEYKSRARKLYLPSGTGWFDFHTGAFFEGGRDIEVEAPLQRMPLFVKEGSIVPIGPVMQYTSEKAADPVTLYVFGNKNGQFDLYEDEGTNYNYEKGRYAITPIAFDAASSTLTIHDRKGGFENMPEGRDFRIVWVNTENPEGVSLEKTQPHQVIHYTGKTVSVVLEKK